MNSLEIKEGSPDIVLPFILGEEFIHCSKCKNCFPVTQDGIPIMWTPELISILTSQTDNLSNLEANIRVYDHISNDYDSSTRRELDIELRMKEAVRQVTKSLSKDQIFHLDYGCGPGHVLGWLKEFNFFQVGLDVSLTNLRNARENTGALVVCGDATNMPFIEKSFDIITESSVLHHIENWKLALRESCRVCKPDGGIVLDSEPSSSRMAWSKLAIAVFNMRFPAYKLLSYVKKDKYMFRDIQQAKLNLLAEIHHQPGTGFPLDVLEKEFVDEGFEVKIIQSPDSILKSVARPNIKEIILNLLSFRNPWNPEYGMFTVVSRKTN